MNGLTSLLKASRGRLLAAIAAGAVSGLGLAGLIALINTALAAPRHEAGWLMPAFVALCLCVFVARALSEAVLVRLSQSLVAELRKLLARRILASPLRDLESHGHHRLLAALTEDVSKIATLLTRLPTFCINAAVALGCFAYLGWLAWPLMLAAIACVGTAVGGFALAQRFAEGALERSRQASDDLYKHFVAVTSGTKELQLHAGRRRAFVSRWLDTSIAAVRLHFVKGMTVFAFAESAGLMTFFGFVGLLLFLPSSWTTSDPAVLTGYALTFLYMVTPIEVIVGLAPDFGQFKVALKALDDLHLSLEPVAPEHAAASAPSHEFQSLKLVQVAHTYRSEADDSAFTLGPIDLTVRPGEILFITGGNGSGKTTLAKLIAGLYAPEVGHIAVNGQTMGANDAHVHRELMAAIFPDFYLFEDLLGLDDPELEATARGLLSSLKLDGKVRLDKGRFSTLALSQGQRKRLALLAAILEDRAIYLFDEWAADQDPVFKRVFYREVLPMLKARGKAVVAITHDDAYFDAADRHLKLESGRIAALDVPGLPRPVVSPSSFIRDPHEVAFAAHSGPKELTP